MPAKSEKMDKDMRRRESIYRLITPPLGLWLSRRYGYSYDKSFDPDKIEGPLIVCIDHTCALDPLFVSAAFRNRMLSFVASEHILRDPKWGRLLDKYFSLIPHSKGRSAKSTALAVIRRVRKGGSIFLAPEGEQTWDGVSSEIRQATGGLIRGSGATLVTYKIEGGYLTWPRWANSPRKGKAYGHPVKVYSPEMLAGMSDEEIEKAIDDDLRFDFWEWQKSKPGGPLRYRCRKGGNAEGLERAVFSCPECRRMGTLGTSGDSISCGCGFRVRLGDTGFFEGASPFETIRDWEEADRKLLAAVLDAEKRAQLPASGDEDEAARGDASEIFADDDALLRRIEEGHSSEELACGRLSLVCEGGGLVLELGDHRFGYGDIDDMKMVLAGRILFSTRDGYYEIISKDANMRKYLIALELDRETSASS